VRVVDDTSRRPSRGPGHTDDASCSHAETTHDTRTTKLIACRFSSSQPRPDPKPPRGRPVAGEPAAVIRLLHTVLLLKCGGGRKNTAVRDPDDGGANPENRANATGSAAPFPQSVRAGVRTVAEPDLRPWKASQNGEPGLSQSDACSCGEALTSQTPEGLPTSAAETARL
jgi:hypothetical protein